VNAPSRAMALAVVSLLLVFLAGAQTPALAAANCPDSAPTDPCLTLTPSSGPVGTQVQISGRITHDRGTVRRQFHHPSYFGLIHDFTGGFPGHAGECELLVGTDPSQIHLAADGRVTGSFVVGSSGSCFQEDGTHATQPARYDLSVGCHACSVASFQVTETLPFTGWPLGWLPAAAVLMILSGGALVLMTERRRGTTAGGAVTTCR
jgi:hypothetical protein